jgi:hypothetical protein
MVNITNCEIRGCLQNGIHFDEHVPDMGPNAGERLYTGYSWVRIEDSIVQVCAQNGILAVASFMYHGPNPRAEELNITGQFDDYDFGNADALDDEGSDWRCLNLADVL